MQNAEDSNASSQFDDLNNSYRSVVSDLVSLIERVQASIKLIESAIARESPPGDLEAASNIVVLDDVTPRYVKAGAALNTCNAGLGVALHVLLDARTLQDETGELAGCGRGAVHSAAALRA
jgi:hypothetical protein